MSMDEAIEETTPEVVEAENERPEVNAVVVHRVVRDNGDIACVVEAVGDVRSTEVLTVLALGVKQYKERIGL